MGPLILSLPFLSSCCILSVFDNWNHVYSLWLSFSSSLSLSFYTLSSSRIFSHMLEKHYSSRCHWPLLRIMYVFMHACMYLYLIGVSWASLVWGVPAVWLSVDRRGRHTFSVSSSLKSPRQLNDMSLYWLHGYIDSLLENMLKDRMTFEWSLCNHGE